MASPTPSATAVPQPPICFHERWKLSKKETLSSSRRKGIKSRKCSFTGRCARLVREQRARFYIMRRCVIMLVCWHDYGDS